MCQQLLPRVLVASGIFAALFSGSGFAQQKHPIAISGESAKSRYVQQLAIDVDDVPGHQVRVLENVRIFPADKQPIVDGERIVEWWGRGLSNYVGGVGPVWGYNTWITDKVTRFSSSSLVQASLSRLRQVPSEEPITVRLDSSVEQDDFPRFEAIS